MSIKEAAVKVLQEAGTALSAEEITRRMLRDNLWQAGGKTPHLSVSSQLARDIKHQGSNSPFVRTGRNTFALRDSMGVKETPAITPSAVAQNAISFADCAEKVLREYGRGQPMSFKEITRIAVERGWLETEGKTPASTMGSLIGSEIRHQKNLGKPSRFVKHAPGYVGLNQTSHQQFELQDGANARKTPTTPSKSKQLSLSFTDCAARVLSEYGDGKPMSYMEIIRIALKNGWLETEGKTPASTMGSLIGSEIRHQKSIGKQPRFARPSPGYVELNQVVGHGLTEKIDQHNQNIREKLLQSLLAMSPNDFEEFIAQRLLIEMGFKPPITVTQSSHDRGIDVRGNLIVDEVVEIKMAVQVKKWKKGNNVQAPTVQQVRGSLGAHEQGLIITTSDFSKGARVEAEQSDKTPIALMNGEQLLSLLLKYDIGVERTTHNLFTLDPNFTTEPEQ